MSGNSLLCRWWSPEVTGHLRDLNSPKNYNSLVKNADLNSSGLGLELDWKMELGNFSKMKQEETRRTYKKKCYETWDRVWENM